ncbi:hypothetical protein OBP_221 [Pseudomonas phage OBP]|uniref:hypothetical protein n=1 Tax=Pseudomonas phage OBP TaxID=1124849 RepID=UPI000240D5C1|nr:hypothetical protein OBP_221 [Pseudomonas phage OBP]AEV89658.1 hypothetical protein OBP_221 [Pseudomonas phage OBP]
MEITIDLDVDRHGVSSKIVKVEDIAWMSGHARRPGCYVTMKDGSRYKSTNDSIALRQRLDQAKANDTKPQRG